MVAEPKNVDYVLGRIESHLEIITKTLAENRLADAQYRTDIRKELSNLTERMQLIEGAQSSMQEDIAEIKPKVLSHQEEVLMTKGARHATHNIANWAWRIWGVISAGIGGVLALMADHWIHPK